MKMAKALNFERIAVHKYSLEEFAPRNTRWSRRKIVQLGHNGDEDL